VEHSLLGKCPEHLKDTRWKPGQSGNPSGLNGRPRFEAIVAKILDEKIHGTDTTPPSPTPPINHPPVERL